MTFNFPCYGGSLSIEPDANGSDGLLDVITFRQGSVPSGLRYLAGVLTRRHHLFRDVVRLRGTSVRFSSDQRVPYQLDGDYGGRLPLEIEMLPSRVHLLLPPGDGK
jgi:diacylglycerol kinase family enzyme